MLSVRTAGPARAAAARTALALAGSALLAASAQVAVPMIPVPITLQTLAIPLLALAFGRSIAIGATLLYLLEGAAGLPVFAPLHTGLSALTGPTAGYLWTFPVAAYVTGLLLDRGLAASYAGRWAAVFLGTATVFAGGAWWLTAGFGMSAGHALAVGVVPFLIGDVLKVSLAAALPSQAAAIAARFNLR